MHSLNRFSPTHNRGVLGLALSNVLSMGTNIVPHLHTSSDHKTLITTLTRYESRGINKREKLEYDECDRNLLLQVLATPSRPLSLDPEEIDTSLMKDLRTAVTASILATRTNSKGAPWWTEDCRKAIKAFRIARKSGPVSQE